MTIKIRVSLCIVSQYLFFVHSVVSMDLYIAK